MKDLWKKNNGKNGVDEILRKSSKAICAPSEREVVVKPENFTKTMKTLQNSDWRVIGTSHGSGPKKIWFIKKGSVF